jgi:hypothetical protein
MWECRAVTWRPWAWSSRITGLTSSAIRTKSPVVATRGADHLEVHRVRHGLAGRHLDAALLNLGCPRNSDLQHASGHGALAAQDLLDLVERCLFRRGRFGGRAGRRGERRLGRLQRASQRFGDGFRLAVATEMDVHDLRGFTGQVVVHGEHVHAACRARMTGATSDAKRTRSPIAMAWPAPTVLKPAHEPSARAGSTCTPPIVTSRSRRGQPYRCTSPGRLLPVCPSPLSTVSHGPSGRSPGNQQECNCT